ncbi:MAG: ABC transporter ATP-binding protein, partial [Actinomycetota bacterium]|nr:ABC transporter ATP-binding protein [Actinomycetota bacterium]
GSGKTTLMRAIVGSQYIDNGTITVLGQPAGSPGVRARVGYMAQAPALYSDLTVTENLQYFARIYSLPMERAAEVIAQVDMTYRATALVSRLSGGETSRTSLAVALLARPSVLILDEPTVGLDPVLRQSLWRMFRMLADAGATLLVSSHVMDEASRCDALVLMREGAILFEGAQEELYERAGVDDIEAAFIALASGPAAGAGA